LLLAFYGALDEHVVVDADLERHRNHYSPTLPEPPLTAGSRRVALKKKAQLTATAGRVILVENTDERPVLLANPGMAMQLTTLVVGGDSCMITIVDFKETKKTQKNSKKKKTISCVQSSRSYYRKRDMSDETNGGGSGGGSGSGGLGTTVTLGPSDKATPFTGDVPRGGSVTIMDNRLCKVPVARHAVPPSLFLIVRSSTATADDGAVKTEPGSSAGGSADDTGTGGRYTRFAVLPITDLYAAGQLQPLHEVPAPSSKEVPCPPPTQVLFFC
jgi:hypothetical protein